MAELPVQLPSAPTTAAQARARFFNSGNAFNIVLPAVPWLIVGIVVVAGAALTAIASWAPSRRATRVSPVAALAVE